MQNLTARGHSQEAQGREERPSGRAGATEARISSQQGKTKHLDQKRRRRQPFPFPSSIPLRSGSRNMQSHQLHMSEPVRAAGRKKQKRSADHEEPDDDGGDEPPRRSRNTKAAQTTSTIRGLLRGFFEQQLRLDAQRQEMMERHAQERLFFEEQWRQSMRRMEQERLMLEQAWMEREEQRRIREEGRAERRDALLTSLLTRLLQGDL